MTLIVCLGSGNNEAFQQTQKVATQHNLECHGILDTQTNCQNSGVYHTSIYDLKPAELERVLNNCDCKFIVLDQDSTAYENYYDFVETMRIAARLQKLYDVVFLNSNINSWVINQLYNNPAFCIMPFIGVHSKNNQVSHCCFMSSSKNDGFYSDYSNNIRKKILDGIKINECSMCYAQEEKFNLVSVRQRWTQTYSTEFNIRSEQDLINNIKPTFAQVSLDNRCNALCRMCSPQESNLISREYKKIGIISDQTKQIRRNQFDIVDLKTIKRINIAGGEPTINTDFLKFLERCLDHGRNDIQFEISSNASALPKKMIELIKEFPNMKFFISVDGFDTLNYYIRWPIQWKNWTKNVSYLVSENRVANFHTVLSIYNIAHLYPLYEYLDQYINIPCSINYLTTPMQLNPWNHPRPELVLSNISKIKNLKRYQTDHVFKNFITGIEHGINSRPFNQLLLDEFYKFNDALDKSRGVKLEDYIPDLRRLQ